MGSATLKGVLRHALHSQPRMASVRAVGYCDLYALSQDAFERVLSHYPDFATHIHKIAQQRQEQAG